MQDDAKTTIWKPIVAVLEKIVKLEDLEEVTRLAEEAKGRKWKEHSSDLGSKLALCRIMLFFRPEYPGVKTEMCRSGFFNQILWIF